MKLISQISHTHTHTHTHTHWLFISVVWSNLRGAFNFQGSNGAEGRLLMLTCNLKFDGNVLSGLVACMHVNQSLKVSSGTTQSTQRLDLSVNTTI